MRVWKCVRGWKLCMRVRRSGVWVGDSYSLARAQTLVLYHDT